MMNKKRNRFIAFLLTVALVLPISPVSANSINFEKETIHAEMGMVDTYKYINQNGYIEIIAVSANSIVKVINEDDERLILYEIKNLQFNTNFNFNNRENMFESAEKQVIDLQEEPERIELYYGWNQVSCRSSSFQATISPNSPFNNGNMVKQNTNGSARHIFYGDRDNRQLENLSYDYFDLVRDMITTENRIGNYTAITGVAGIISIALSGRSLTAIIAGLSALGLSNIANRVAGHFLTLGNQADKARMTFDRIDPMR